MSKLLDDVKEIGAGMGKRISTEFFLAAVLLVLFGLAQASRDALGGVIQVLLGAVMVGAGIHVRSGTSASRIVAMVASGLTAGIGALAWVTGSGYVPGTIIAIAAFIHLAGAGEQFGRPLPAAWGSTGGWTPQQAPPAGWPGAVPVQPGAPAAWPGAAPGWTGAGTMPQPATYPSQPPWVSSSPAAAPHQVGFAGPPEGAPLVHRAIASDGAAPAASSPVRQPPPVPPS
jgi:hypothetical protein